MALFTPRGLFAMVITSNPNNLSPVLTINVFEFPNPSASDLNMEDLTFGDMDYGNATLNFSKSKQPQPRRSNKLQKMGNFISDYSDRRAHIQPTSHSNNLPLFSLISSISNSRESKKDSRKRRNHRSQRLRPSSTSSGVSSVEGAFGVTKVGKASASARGTMERMWRDDEENENDTGQEGNARHVEIQTVRVIMQLSHRFELLIMETGCALSSNRQRPGERPENSRPWRNLRRSGKEYRSITSEREREGKFVVWAGRRREHLAGQEYDGRPTHR